MGKVGELRDGWRQTGGVAGGERGAGGEIEGGGEGEVLIGGGELEPGGVETGGGVKWCGSIPISVGYTFRQGQGGYDSFF